MKMEDTLLDKFLYGSIWLITQILGSEIGTHILVGAVFLILGIIIGATL